MPRHDLLALSMQDLEVLANRGLVRRAVRDLDELHLTARITEEPNGDVTFIWSDGVSCILHSGRGIELATCSIPSASVSRYALRSVLAYQRWQQSLSGSGTPAASDEPRAWNPGEIPDEVWEKHCSRAVLQRARKLFDAGQLVEALCGAKPSALIHTMGISVRFMTQHNLSLAVCDCPETQPCVHAVVASWAFRLLADGATAGIVTTSDIGQPTPAPLQAMEVDLSLLAEEGFVSATRTLIDGLRRHESRLRAAQFIWPAECLSELLLEYQRYKEHDARFDPAHLSMLFGELLARCSSYQSSTCEVPKLFVAGLSSDHQIETKALRLVGLGCEACLRTCAVELRAFLQQEDNGAIVAVTREFADPDSRSGTEPPPFGVLARSHGLRGSTFSALGKGQLLVRGGKRTASHRFSVGRAPFDHQPQTYVWENLRAPLLAEGFCEIGSRLALRPPACLAPRRLGGDVFVAPIREIQAARFDVAAQSVVADMTDPGGGTATLLHPYTSRGKDGAEQLIVALQTGCEPVLFVAGHFRRTSAGLACSPIGVVLQGCSGRRLLQPWIEDAEEPVRVEAVDNAGPAGGDPLRAFHEDVIRALGALLLAGVANIRPRDVRMWEELATRTAELGFVRLTEPLRQLASEIETRHRTTGRSRESLFVAMKRVCIVACLLHELI